MIQTPLEMLILSGVKGDTRRYRTFHLHQQLTYAGVAAQVAHITTPGIATRAAAADLLVLHRVPADRYVEKLIRLVHAHDGMVLYDTDDLIFDPSAFQWIHSPDFQDPIRVRVYQEEMCRQRQTLDRCDGVLVSTDYLAGLVRQLGKPVWVHRNAANFEMLANSRAASRRPADDRVVIGYASGTPTHNRDFALVAPALETILEEYSQTELWLIGYLDPPARLARFGARVRTVPPVNWRDLPALLAQLDINLAPLVPDNPFSQSKSEIKFMEAALVGVPTLASATDAFQFAISPGRNGLLVQHDADWFAGLQALMDPDFRQVLGGRARTDVLARYTPPERARNAIDTLNAVGIHHHHPLKLVFNPDPSADPARLAWPLEMEAYPSLRQMGLYSLRRRGPGTLLKQIWIYLRRLLAGWIPYGGRSHGQGDRRDRRENDGSIIQ
ncbi:MAG TPA: glycosyltransferase family 4 protein [Anaerolineaceae bacterium]|nr:glycosyltransferase family 4 protein [Anaerolineaceae bacterium]